MDKKEKKTDNLLDGTNKKKEKNEDVTEFGEFVCSFDRWTSPEEQKLIAKHLEEVTKKK